MAFKIGKNFKQKINVDDTLDDLENIICENLADTYYKQHIINTNNPNISNNIFDPNYVTQIKYFGIVSELPDVNDAELGQLVLKQDKDNYIIYVFNGKSWVELDQSTYNVRIDSVDDYTDMYGNGSWRTYIDNCVKCDVQLGDEALSIRDSIYKDCI